MDNRFRVEVVSKTENPQQLVYLAMHQDYSSEFVFNSLSKIPSEKECGNIVVNRLLAGGRGHYGCLEHPQITFNCGWFPHSTMQQARTHRIGVSFDVQSFRYTSEQFLQVAAGDKDVEDVFYFRPAGDYTNRSGKKYFYSEQQREKDLEWGKMAIAKYKHDFDSGMSEEHVRSSMLFDYRQHFICSFTLRSLMHFLDLRNKLDAQLEIQQLCELMMPHFDSWVPSVAQWYRDNRLHKAKLAP